MLEYIAFRAYLTHDYVVLVIYSRVSDQYCRTIQVLRQSIVRDCHSVRLSLWWFWRTCISSRDMLPVVSLT